MRRKISIPLIDAAPRGTLPDVRHSGPRPRADRTLAKPVAGSEPTQPQRASLRAQVIREAGITPFASAGTGAVESPAPSRPVTYEDLYRRLRGVKQGPGRLG